MRTGWAIAAAALLAAGCRPKLDDPSVGTIELVYAPRTDATGTARRLLLDETRERLVRRLEPVAIPFAVATDGERVTVTLRGDTAPALLARLRGALARRARLEFREVADEALARMAASTPPPPPATVAFVPAAPAYREGLSATIEAPTAEAIEAARLALAPQAPAGTALALLPPGRPAQPWSLLLLGPAVADNDDVRDAVASTSDGMQGVGVSLRDEAAARFEAASRRSVGRRLAIVLDGRIVRAPYVRGPIPSGRVGITLGSDGTREEARDLAVVLKARAWLPVELRLEEERRIPPAR